MAYVDSRFLPNERVVHRSRLHWKIFVVPWFFSAVFLAISIASLKSRVLPAGVFSVSLAAVLAIVPFLKRANCEFIVTDKGVVYRKGVMTTRTLELLHARIESITVHQGLTGKLLGFGDVVVGIGGRREIFQGIARPLEFRGAVHAAQVKAPAASNPPMARAS